MHENFDSCYRAVRSRDQRFDGWFFTAVTSTRIYCRPSCPALTPKRENVRFYPTAAAAQQAGFRACLRCRPDAAPGSPQWLGRADVAARAVKLILHGVVDREGVSGLASRLGYSERQLHRVLVAEVGTGALSLARAQRAQTARLLLQSTDVPITQVAFAAGFQSVRQFNETVRAVFARTPTELRRKSAGHTVSPTGAAAQSIALRLAYRRPFAVERMFEFLAQRGIPGLEAYDGATYSRVLHLPHGEGTVSLAAGEGPEITAVFTLDDLRDLTSAIARCRHLLNLDADPVAVDEALGSDPLLAPLVSRTPGLRCRGRWTALSSRYGRSWASRCPWRAREPWRARSCGPRESRLKIPACRSRTRFPAPPRWPSWRRTTQPRSRCPPPGGAPWPGSPTPWPTESSIWTRAPTRASSSDGCSSFRASARGPPPT